MIRSLFFKVCAMDRELVNQHGGQKEPPEGGKPNLLPARSRSVWLGAPSRKPGVPIVGTALVVGDITTVPRQKRIRDKVNTKAPQEGETVLMRALGRNGRGVAGNRQTH